MPGNRRYFARDYADDGTRFCEGMVARRLQAIQRSGRQGELRGRCFDAAKAAGVNPVELLAVADYLSGIEGVEHQSNPSTGPSPFPSGDLGRPHCGHAGSRSEPGGSLLSV